MDLFLLRLNPADATYHCGAGFDFSGQLPNLVSLIILLIQIAVPILLIVFGMLDLGKSVMAQKDDEIKKGQQTFVKRLITGIIVFFVIVVVKLVIGLVSTDKNITRCMNCFLNATTASDSCARK